MFAFYTLLIGLLAATTLVVIDASGGGGGGGGRGRGGGRRWRPCVNDNVTGNIPETDVTATNRSCVQTLIVPNAQYNVSWSDGTYSLLGVRLQINFNSDRITTVGTGTVVAGTAGYQGLPAVIDFVLTDNSNGCRNGSGVSHTSGNVYVNIGRRGRSGRSIWRYCGGQATLDFSPPVTSTVVPSTTSTFVATLAYCLSSCGRRLIV